MRGELLAVLKRRACRAINKLLCFKSRWKDLRIAVWDATFGHLRGRFTCDGWYQHSFSGGSFSMFACGTKLIACGTKTGAYARNYAAINIYKITDNRMQLAVFCLSFPCCCGLKVDEAKWALFCCS